MCLLINYQLNQPSNNRINRVQMNDAVNDEGWEWL